MGGIGGPVGICVMRRHDRDNGAWFGNSVQLGHERHHVGYVFEDMTANYLVEFVVGKRIGSGAQVMNNIGVCFGIWIETHPPPPFFPAAAHVKNFPAWSYG